jgi:hypothetical protein
VRTERSADRNERQCLDKRAYASQTDAKMTASRIRVKRGVPLRAYRCPNCHWWHLTKAGA